MKRNKLIYLIIFSLVFLGFTSGVKAKECIYYADGVKHADVEYTQSTNSLCHDQYNGQWRKDNSPITDAYLQGIKKVCAKKSNGAYEYRPTVYSLETANACSDNGFTWKDVESIIIDVYNLSNGNNGNSGNSGNNGNTTYVCCNSNKQVNVQVPNESECYKRTGHTWVPSSQCSAAPNSSNTSDPDNNSAGNGSTNASSGSTGGETIVIGFDCNDPSVNSIIATVKTIYNLLRYATPVILILMGSVDFLKATVAGKDDEIEKNKKKFMNRLFIAIIIFLILSIFQLTTNVLEKAGVTNSNSWVECWNHVNEN